MSEQPCRPEAGRGGGPARAPLPSDVSGDQTGRAEDSRDARLRQGAAQASRPFALTPDRQRLEEQLQQAVVQMLRAYLPPAVWWCASLSGVRLTPAVARLAKSCGLERGAPDLGFVFPDGESRYLELKAEDGDLSAEQRRLAHTLGPDRFKVARSVPQARSVLTGWLAPYGLRLLTDGEAIARVRIAA